MRLKTTLLVALFSVFLVLIARATGYESLDSLLTELEKPHHDTVKFELLLEIGDYFYFNDPVKANTYFIEARELAEKNLENSGDPYERKFTQQRAKAIRYIAYVYFHWGDHVTALEMYLQALAIGESINCSNNIYNSYNNIAIINHSLKEYETARGYYNKALEITERDGIVEGSVKLYNNLGVLYQDLGNETGNIPERENYYMSALEMFNMTLHLRKELNDLWGETLCYNNLGNLTRDAALLQQDEAVIAAELSRADGFYRQSFDLAIRINDMLSQSKALGNMAKSNLVRYDFESIDNKERQMLADSAVSMAVRAYRLAGSLNSLDQQNNAALIAMNSLSAAGDYVRALEYARIYNETSEKVFSDTKAQSLNEMRIRYEAERMEDEIQILNQRNEIKIIQLANTRKERYFYITIVLSLLGLSVVLVMLYRNRRRNARLIEEKNERLQALNSTKDKFISILAHDLKSPFSAFHNISSILRNDFDTIEDDDKKRWIEQMYLSAGQLNNLLNNMLEWAVIKHDKADAETADLALYEVAEESARSLSGFASEHGLAVMNSVDRDIIVRADRRYLSSVINNLLTNAVKFSVNGEPVTIDASLNGGHATVTVEDKGIGIAPDDVEMLFRIDVDVRRIGGHEGKGTGMGLIICRELVERMGGEIWVESEPGRGSRFIFTLPAADGR